MTRAPADALAGLRQGRSFYHAMLKMLRFSFRFYLGAVAVLFAASDNQDVAITANQIILLPLAVVGTAWIVWSLSALGDGLAAPMAAPAEFTRALVGALIDRESADADLSDSQHAASASPRMIRLNDARGAHSLTLPAAGELPYRDLVGHFVIRGAVRGSYTARAMMGRRVCGRLVDFGLWRDVTDESYVFRKTNHGARLIYPVGETLDKLTAGLPLANERMCYPPDAVSVE